MEAFKFLELTDLSKVSLVDKFKTLFETGSLTVESTALGMSIMSFIVCWYFHLCYSWDERSSDLLEAVGCASLSSCIFSPSEGALLSESESASELLSSSESLPLLRSDPLSESELD